MGIDWLPRDSKLKNHGVFGPAHWGKGEGFQLTPSQPLGSPLGDQDRIPDLGRWRRHPPEWDPIGDRRPCAREPAPRLPAGRWSGCGVPPPSPDWKGLPLDAEGVQLRSLVLTDQTLSLENESHRHAGGKHNRRLAAAEIARALRLLAGYRLEPTRVYFIDNARGFGHRDEIPLQGGP
jgi:hypothetical protein